MDIEDVIYNADGSVTTVYSDGTTVTNEQTGGWSTGGTLPGPTSGTIPVTGKKWWETALGIIPSVLTSIFGGSAQPTNQTTNYPGPTQQSGMNSNMILMIAAAAIVIILLMKKK